MISYKFSSSCVSAFKRCGGRPLAAADARWEERTASGSSGRGGNAVPADGEHIVLHGLHEGNLCAKTFNVYHMLLSMSVNPVSHLNMAVVHV